MIIKRIISTLIFCCSLVCFGLGGRQNAALARKRADYGFGFSVNLVNASPIMVFSTVVLGGFRGLIADVLWLRVSYMQEKGEYFEMVQLSDWITKLEPSSTEVWAYHAWNMAYNISVMMSDPDDGWRWIKNGISLLRDEGLVYNSDDPELYRELGWLYQNKLGAAMGAAGGYYNRMFAEEMKELLGGAALDYAGLSAELKDRMRVEYKLFPEIMQEIEGRYGPLDWLRPESHAVYWAYRGKLCAGEKGARLCDIMIRQSLSMLGIDIQEK